VTFAKGAVILATLEYLGQCFDAGLVDAVLATVPEQARSRLTAAGPTDAVPLEDVYSLWRAADQVIGSRHSRWMEDAGAFSIDSAGAQLYSGIVRKPTPSDFLTQRISLFRLFYQPGEMEVVENGDVRAVVRLSNFADVDPLFCRRQTGGLRRAVELAGGPAAAARHVRCVSDGDAFCEWELTWGGGAPPATP
jgi:hypothetical protein